MIIIIDYNNIPESVDLIHIERFAETMEPEFLQIPVVLLRPKFPRFHLKT